MDNDLFVIKNKYSDNMAEFCEQFFSIILEKEGLLPLILDTYFPNSSSLYDDICINNLEDEFKDYIYSLVDVKSKDMILSKSPSELMSEAEYLLYECKTKEDIQSFKKYYSNGEELCTFNDNRLDTCYVFFAIKKNVDDIKRSFKPNRDDEYGTSVISIQFKKGKFNTLSIKNRYNHSVYNPDATFNNNLDNIILGLTKSFENEYNLNITNNQKFHIPGYVNIKGINYKYNYKINNIYYCPNNIIIKDKKIMDEYLNTSKYLVLDYYIVDLEECEIKLFDNSLEDTLSPFIKGISNLKIVKDEVENIKCIVIDKKRKIFFDRDNTTIFLKIKRRLLSRSDIGFEKRFKDKKKKGKMKRL